MDVPASATAVGDSSPRSSPRSIAPDTVVVVPCYNEARRLPVGGIKELAAAPGMSLILVNDGSSDSTMDVLLELASASTNIVVRDLPRNGGKAETVRLGLLDAILSGAAWVGFCDADLATPVDEILRLRRVAGDTIDVDVVVAARVNLLGVEVERSTVRHYLGRIFATVAGLVLGIRVYDTQCGAKFFRNNATLRHALSQPFHSRWSFDVELLGRLLRGGGGAPPIPVEAIVEVPLQVWRDVEGSKLNLMTAIRSGLELAVIAHHLHRWR